MFSVAKSLAIVALVTFAIWFVARLLGYHLALLPSLLLSVGLTVLLNLGNIARGRRRVVREPRPGWRF